MSVDELRAALEELAEPTACEGTVAVHERLAIMLPDGDVAAVDDPHFVDWLVEHGEPAPFGRDRETLLDPAVRHAIRLKVRGAARISGFELDELLGEVEAVLSPERHLEATLTDVLVYPPGGHFAMHKDTPVAPNLIGTLIVGLPVEHTGGAFHIEDGLDSHTVDWSGPPDLARLPWVALFTDVDHEIDEVEDGARVTLVYALALTERARPVDPRRLERVSEAARTLELPGGGPLMIACTRHVIGPEGAHPQGLDTLRGIDRDLAAVLVRSGLHVRVRTCLAVRDREGDGRDASPAFHARGEKWFARLQRPLLDHEVGALLECVSFEAPWGDDGGGYDLDEVSSLQDRVLDEVPLERWVIRRTAAATLVRAIEFVDNGWIGNGGCEAYLYKLAALEVTRGT